MKLRKLSLLLAVLALLTLLGVSASAAEPIPAAPQVERLHFGDAAIPQVMPKPAELSQAEYDRLKELFHTEIRDHWLRGETQFTVNLGKTYSEADFDAVYATFYNALYTNPLDFFWVDYADLTGHGGPDWVWNGSGWQFSAYKLNMKVVPGADQQEFDAAFDSAVSECFGENIANLSEFEKVLLAHDYLCEVCHYDQVAGWEGTEFESQFPGPEPAYVYCPWGVFTEHRAVCQGIALSMGALMDYAGVENVLVTSANVNHAWNIVKIDGVWYQIDATWDDPVYNETGDFAGNLVREFFLRSDADFGHVKGVKDWKMEYTHYCTQNYSVPSGLSERTPAFAFSERIWTVTDGYLTPYKTGTNLSEREGEDRVKLLLDPTAMCFDRRDHVAYYIDYWGSVKGADLDNSRDMNYSVQAKNTNSGIYLSGPYSSWPAETQTALHITYWYQDTAYYTVGRRPAVYTVSYDANGGKSAPAAQYKIHNERLYLTGDPAVWDDNHRFLGWATEKNAVSPLIAAGTAPYMAGNSWNGNVTFYALWQTIRFTVSFDAAEGTGAPADLAKERGTALRIPDTIPVREHYDFVGWAATPGGSAVYQPGDYYTAEADITLYAVWRGKTYTLTFDLNGGDSGPESVSVVYPNSGSVPAAAPTREHYTFVCWSTDPDNGENAVRLNPGDSFSIWGNTTVYAIWQLNSYTLSFLPNGGTGGPENMLVYWGTVFNLPEEIPVREHYDFAGWTNGEVIFKPGALVQYDVDNDVLLWAMWTPVRYTLSFDLTGAEYDLDGFENAEFTVESPAGIPTSRPQRYGYRFDHWEDADTGDVYYPYYTGKLPLKNTTLRPVFTPALVEKVFAVITDGDTAEVRAYAYNHAHGGSVSLILAQYDAAGRLVDVQLRPVEDGVVEYGFTLNNRAASLAVFRLGADGITVGESYKKELAV